MDRNGLCPVKKIAKRELVRSLGEEVGKLER